MVNISLYLDHSNGRYAPGDVINLEVRVQTSSEQKYRSIYARIKGFAHVSWTESHQVTRDGKSHTEHTTYSSNETLFEHYQTLAGARSGQEVRLAPGSHVYHARFALPRNLPENHENEYGHIRYECKVQMDIPWGFDEKERLSFNIQPHRDLNEFPQLREPMRVQADKTFGCCCWESEPLRVYNVLPRSGFVIGDRVQFTLEMNNESDVVIDSADVKLVEKIVYQAHSPTYKSRESYRTLWSHEFHGNGQLVAPLQNKVFSANLYFNPSYDFRFFAGCGIITVEYYIKSKARTSGCHTNLSNHTTIQIGTVSLGDFGRDFPPVAPPMMPFPSAPLAPVGSPSASAPPIEPISEQPLPSYDDTQKKPSMAPGIGWAGVGNLETPPPTFHEIEFIDNKEKQ